MRQPELRRIRLLGAGCQRRSHPGVRAAGGGGVRLRRRIARREQVKIPRQIAPVLLMAAVMLATNPATPMRALAADNPIVAENSLPGSTGWRLGSLVADDQTQQVKGYASATSVNQNATITLFVSVSPAQTYTIDIYRIGWYSGLGGRLRLHQSGLAGSTQQACPADPTTGLIACHWTPSYSLTVPADWTSGVYLVMLTNSLGFESYIPFVVRDGRPAAFLYQESVNTDQAYNNYPNDHVTGKSLYAFNSYGANTVAGDARAVKVSFDRPYADNGVPNRVEVCYKDPTLDPVKGPTLTVAWRSGYLNRPGQTLTGLTISGEVDFNSNADYVVTNSSHWVYAGTGFKDGDAVHGIVGYEMDRYDTNYPAPTSTNRTLLSSSPFTDTGGVARYSNSSIYQAPSGAWVFASGTMSWSWALDNYVSSLADVRIQRTTSNLLSAFLYGAPIVHDLKVTAPASATQGRPFTVSVVAENVKGNVVTGYNGTVHFSSSDASGHGTLPADSTLTNGQGSFTVTLGQVGSQTLSVSDVANGLSTTVSVTVNAAPAMLVLAPVGPATATAGTPFSFTVTAEDPFGGTLTTYAGIVHFASSDTSQGVALPADSALTNGQGTFTATLIKAGAQTITASDNVGSGSSPMTMTVVAAPTTHLALATNPASTTTAGNAFSVAVSALDQYGNTDRSYAGTVHFTTTDTSTGVALPPDSTLTGGQGTFSATLDRSGSQTITGTDIANASIAGSVTIQATAAAAAKASIVAPPSAVANQPFNVQVTLYDRFGNVATGYVGTLHVTTSDLVAQQLGKMPADYTFTSADAGSHMFSVTLMTLPSQTITVTDTANAQLNATSPPIIVSLL